MKYKRGDIMDNTSKAYQDFVLNSILEEIKKEFNFKTKKQAKEYFFKALMKYDDYIVFVIGSDLAHEKLYEQYETTDIVFEKCVELTKEFEKSSYNNKHKDLYSCIIDFLKNKNLLD